MSASQAKNGKENIVYTRCMHSCVLSALRERKGHICFSIDDKNTKS